MKYYIEKDDKIILADEDLQRLQNTLLFKPDCKDLEVKTSDIDIVLYDGEYYFITDEEYKQKQKENIAKLHLTRGDVFRGLLQARGVTRAQLRQIINNLPEENQEQAITKEMALIDFDEALEFYRGNALIETVGEMLGITSEMMDKFFETKDYRELQKAIQVEEL